MKAFFDPRQLAHAPLKELRNGGFTDYAETPVRADAILAAIRAVHDAGYLDFLKTGPARWAEAGRPGDVTSLLAGFG